MLPCFQSFQNTHVQLHSNGDGFSAQQEHIFNFQRLIDLVAHHFKLFWASGQALISNWFVNLVLIPILNFHVIVVGL